MSVSSKPTSAGELPALGAWILTEWVIVAGLAGVVVYVGWSSLGWPLIHDAPIMHYIAWRIGEGAVPYRDLFDMNFPGAYLLHLAVLRTLGAGDGAWRGFAPGWAPPAPAPARRAGAPWGGRAA